MLPMMGSSRNSDFIVQIYRKGYTRDGKEVDELLLEMT